MRPEATQLRATWRRATVVAIAIMLGCAAHAQECTLEAEPNDTPALATRITGAGPDSSAEFGRGVAYTACLAGELTANDQDAFYWEVGELEAGQRWVIDLESFPGALTSLRVFSIEFAPDGSGVTAAEEVLYTETRDGRQTASDEFLVGPGTYHVGVSASGGTGAYVAQLRPVERIDRGSSAFRPGQELRDAFAVHGPAQGELSQTFTLSAEQAEFLWGLELRTVIGSAATLVLEGPDGRLFEARTGQDGSVRRGSLGLTAGTYRALVQGESPLVMLRLEPQGRRSSGVEIEPNDTWATATLFPPNGQMRGTTGGTDYFRIEVDEAAAASAWDLAAEASGNLTLRLHTNDGSLLTQRTGAAGTISGLHLEQGAYRLEVWGSEGVTYALALGRADPGQAGHEREPNDHVSAATPLGGDGQVRGVLALQDLDVFSLEVTEAQLYRVQVVGPGARRLTMLNQRGNGVLQEDGDGRARLDDLLLFPGVHYFQLSNATVVGEYALRAIALGPAPTPPVAEASPAPGAALSAASRVAAEPPGADPLSIAAPAEPPPPPGWLEMEPNGDRSRSMRLRPGEVHVGRISPPGEVDVYRFHLLADEYVRLELVPPEDGVGFDLVGSFPTARQTANEAGSAAVVESWFLAGDHEVVVRAGSAGSTGYYQLRLTQLGVLEGPARTELGPAEPAAAGGADLVLSIEPSSRPVAAYWHEGQSLVAEARIENTGSRAQRVSFTAAVNDVRSAVDAPADVTLAPGQSLELPLRITLPADLRDDLLLRVELAATSENARAVATFEVAPLCEAEPVSPQAYWPVPPGLRGRFDMLWDGAGASLYGEGAEEYRDPALLDGRVVPGNGANVTASHSPTFELAGGRPVRLVGTLLHPRSDIATASQLKGFRVETSLDGVSYTPVLEAELLSAAVEQAFEFPTPVTARFARLVFVSNHGGGSGARLGEWKLVAEDPAPLGALNLALPGLGGHVAWSEPSLPQFGLPMIGAEPDDVRAINVRGHEGLTVVVGFHNGRAAQVIRLEWQESRRSADTPEARFKDVRVEVSLAGPAGPWSPLADWTLERDATGLAVLELAGPTWARYLRLSAPAWGEGLSFWPPDQLTVIERQADGEYLSALGEWGMDAREAVYEAFLEGEPRAPVATDSATNTLDAGDSPAQATPLASGHTARGTVEVAVDDDWYRVTVPPGENHLELRLSGDPEIAYRYHLTDAEGRAVAFETEEGAGGTRLTLFAEPGDYLLGLEEPKRTVIFSWDTSGSVGPFQDITYSALASFTLALDGDREAVQLLAFNDPAPRWLLPIWSSEPQRVQRAIAEFDRAADSSNAEGALLAATRALAGRDGTRAILLITDAVSTGYQLTQEL